MKAKYRVTVLFVERDIVRWREVVAPTAGGGTCWLPYAMTRFVRGFAIERIGDGAVFWRTYPGGWLDARAAEQRFSEDVLGFALSGAAAFADTTWAVRPPVGFTECRYRAPAQPTGRPVQTRMPPVRDPVRPPPEAPRPNQPRSPRV